MIRCTVSVHHKTGVEMEALTGASIAALTVYDMCKALSHDIVICELRLIAKDGGKSRLRTREPRAMTAAAFPAPAPVYGLILAGGASSRMKRDKAALLYRGRSQLDRACRARGPARGPVFVSVRAGARRRPGARALAADRRFGRRAGPHRRHSFRARRPSRRPRGWCWPAICPF